MAADLDQAYIRWAHEELSDPGCSEEISIAQMLDHGSISFGKYAVESLSWEKRSVFTHNRRQEELEKFKAPGLVAKKKAYFEEYYKKIRTSKGLADDNQQTEVALDYGADGSISSQTGEADGSISSQTGEEDETFVRAKNTLENIAATCHKEYPVGVSVELGKDPSNSFSVGFFSSEFPVSHSDIPNRCSDEINLEKNSSDASQIMCLDLDVGMPTSQGSNRIVGLKILEMCPSDISQVTGFDTCADFAERTTDDINLKNNGNGASLMQQEANDSNVPHLKNEVCNASFETSTRNNEGCISAFEPCNVSQPKHLDSTTLERNLPVFSTVPECKQHQTKSAANKKEEESNYHIKESGTSIQNRTKPGDKIKTNHIKSGNQSKYLQLKKNCNEGSTISSRNMDCGMLRNNKSSLLSSSKPKEARAKVTIPRPFSFATEKRVIIDERPSTGVRGACEKIDTRAANTFRSLIRAKQEFPLQIISKKATVSSGTSTKLSEKSRHQQLLSRKPLVMDYRLNNMKGRDGLADRPRPWSINLPASERSHSNSRSPSGVRNKVREDKREGNAVGRTREFRHVPNAIDGAQKSKTEVKKMLPLRRNNLAANGNNKMRQEVKRWR